MNRFNENIAMVAGTNAAIIAELIDYLIRESDQETVIEYEKVWCRCSMKMATVYCPYLTKYQVEDALWALRDKGIISKGNFNDDRFDHTNWYAFTEYGSGLMDAEGLSNKRKKVI